MFNFKDLGGVFCVFIEGKADEKVENRREEVINDL